MAEQINKNDYINHPDRIGGFNYYSLGETTIKQLQQNNLISSKTRKFQNKKPDAIVTDDEKDIVVYIENKDIGKLSTADDIQSAIDQEIDVAKAVNAPIFVVTDTVDTYWINTLTGERIISEDGTELRVVFKPNENKRQPSLFTPKRGNSKYTKTFCFNNRGEYPIYSANNNEPLAYANFFDYDGSFLTISVNGIAGRITKKEGKFSINADRVILVPLVENIDLDYIRFTVEPILRSKIKGRMGHDGQNEFTKLPGGTIERVKISIPIKEDGSFDLEAQQEIANKYRKIQQINSSIYQQIDELINIKIAL